MTVECSRVSERNEKIFKALNALMKTCGYSGESGTEAFFDMLFDAVHDVRENWDVVEESHEDGLSFDVNSMLAYRIESYLEDQEAQAATPLKPNLRLVKA
jgi:hypothetical protein